MVVERIVRGTSLSEGDVKSALVSLSNVVCDAMKLGTSAASGEPTTPGGEEDDNQSGSPL